MRAWNVAYRGIGWRKIGWIVAAGACVLAAACSSSEAPSDRDPVVTLYRCEESKVEARFMSRRMALFIDGKAYALQQAESASGARYTGRDLDKKIEFWDKGDEATLTFGDRIYPACTK